MYVGLKGTDTLEKKTPFLATIQSEEGEKGKSARRNAWKRRQGDCSWQWFEVGNQNFFKKKTSFKAKVAADDSFPAAAAGPGKR